jgi:acetyltransferase
MTEPLRPLQHYLRPLLAPASVALVGASERPGSVSRVVLENLLGSDYRGTFHAINRTHRRVLGVKCHKSLADVGAPIDLAIAATPAGELDDVIDDAGAAGVRALIVLADAPWDDAWLRRLVERARSRRVRLLGPGACGIVRSDLGLNAATTDVPVVRGRLALVAQSGAVASAMLDFAAPLGIGFSTVISVGAAADVGFGEILDALLGDVETDAILLYVETVRDARRFLSALRAAARTKPVVVLRAGRSHDPVQAHAGSPTADAVFDAAIRRAGTVRVRTYTQLFAAARILSMGRIPRGDALAIVANGRGPGLLAADTAVERGVRLASLSPETQAKLQALVPDAAPPLNPVDVHSDASPERFASAVAAVIADSAVDAVVALHVPRPATGATDAARAVAAASRRSDKPVLGAWLGAVDRPEAREALEAGRIANFYTPENAVEAFSFLAAYRRHQDWLLEVPPSQPEPTAPDVATAEDVRRQAAHDRVSMLDDSAAARLLLAFGIVIAPRIEVANADQAKASARGIGYPVTLSLERARDVERLQRDRLRDGRAVARAFAELAALRGGGRRRGVAGTIVLRKEPRSDALLRTVAAIHTDPVFGAIISLGGALMLPPLNRRLAGDLVDGVHAAAGTAAREPLVRLLLQLSALACALPWVVELEIDPLLVHAEGVHAASARVIVDARRVRKDGYPHLAIHPYPAELASDYVARDGTHVHVRPIRPDDALREQAFVAGLSEETRYFRFFHRMQQLTAAMLARFTQVDYDREMALVALVPDAQGIEGWSFAGVARYIESPDGESAEYAIVVGDAWQRHGIGGALMERLIAIARRKGLLRLEGTVLRENSRMLAFVERLGFRVEDDAGDLEQVSTSLDLAAEAREVHLRKDTQPRGKP